VLKKHLNSMLLLLTGLLLVSASIFSAAEQTIVYKVIAEDGSISFSDEPQEGAKAIQVKPVTTIPAIDVKQNKALTPKQSNSDKAGYYQNLSIVSPANDTAFNSGNGNVQVTVQAQPALRGGDLFELQLDGKFIASQRDTSFQLTSVDRGTHTLTVKIVNGNKETLKVAISSMTIHRPVAKPFSIN